METLEHDHNVSRHKCLIYDGDPSEQLPVVVPLLLDALEDNFRCLYLGDPAMVRMVEHALQNRGVDTERESARGAMVFSSDRSHLVDGEFDPRSMVDGLGSMIDESVQAGFAGLCATGDMRWELGADHNFDRLVEYEARLEKLFVDKPLRGICQYHRATVPAQAVRDALLTHRSTFLGHALNHDNLFYIPPDLLLSGDAGSRARQGEWMYQQIARVLDAEHKRDKALAELARANRDLEHRVSERTAELQIANQQLESFSYSVSHDLRAPLRHIGGFSEILAEDFAGKLGDDGDKYLRRIREGVLHMQELIDGMLALSRAVKAELRREGIDLGTMAREVFEGVRQEDTARSVELVVQEGLNALGDRALLRAVLTNLIGNSWKFSGKQATARIEVGRLAEDKPGWRVFFVRDNGAGFDPRNAGRLFSPFQRLHTEAEFPGTGVGLATVERIISRHGGRIWAESAPGHGATFFFTLPEAVLAS